MKEILSDNLQNIDAVPLGNQTGILDIYDGLSTPFSDDVVVLSDRHREQIEAFVTLAADNYTPEPTLVNELFALPSLLTRVDCTIDEQGNISPYEMEDSPSGQGITNALLTASGQDGIRDIVRGHFEAMLGELPTIIVSNARNHGTDDRLIFGGDRYIGIGNDPTAINTKAPVIVKAIPGLESSRTAYMKLREQAVAPLETEGDKTYAEKIGLLACIRTADELLLDETGALCSQVVKARLGSMALGVSIYLTGADKKRFGSAGTVTASRLKRDLEKYSEENEGSLLQAFIPPIQIENAEGRSNAILRVFTLLDRQGGQVRAQAIGGCYVARNEVLLHGASNAVSGAVLVQ